MFAKVSMPDISCISVQLCHWGTGSAPPELPKVMVNWHNHKMINITAVIITQVPQSWGGLQVIVFAASCQACGLPTKATADHIALNHSQQSSMCVAFTIACSSFDLQPCVAGQSTCSIQSGFPPDLLHQGYRK